MFVSSGDPAVAGFTLSLSGSRCGMVPTRWPKTCWAAMQSDKEQTLSGRPENLELFLGHGACSPRMEVAEWGAADQLAFVRPSWHIGLQAKSVLPNLDFTPGTLMSLHPAPENLALLLGLSFFFGLAYEEYFGPSGEKVPGGVRTFPLLALTGAMLYLLDPVHVIAFSVGLLALGAWLFAYYRSCLGEQTSVDSTRAGLVALISNVLAYLLGPIVLAQAHWLAVGLTVSAVLLLHGRAPLHALARRIPADEFTTLGKFLLLIGVILPILPDRPLMSLTTITPYQVWLAVVVVSTLSYGSYLALRLLSPERGVLVTAVLGGLYSSTVTTVALARRIRENPDARGEFQAGVMLATALMYLRLTILIAVFNRSLARGLAPSLLVLLFLGLGLAAGWFWYASAATSRQPTARPVNPLELRTALLFALIFVVISLASSWVKGEFGRVGVFWLASIVGLTDIDPFVLSLAQGGVEGLSLPAIMIAVLIAASSNNLLKACYAVMFAGWRDSLPIVGALGLMAAVGLVFASLLAGG